MKELNKKIKDFLIPVTDSKIKREFDMININNIRVISFIGGLMELIALIFVALDVTTTRNRMWNSLSVGIIAIICFASYFLATFSRRYKWYNHYVINALTSVFFILLFGFSIFSSCRQYMQGDQIITFYIIALCFVSFITVPPIIGIPMIVLNFSTFFTIIWFFDRADNMQNFSFFAFASVCIVASIVRYRLTFREIRQNIETESMNTYLEKMIRYDYLTRAKNRYALIEDSKDYYNKEIIVCMSDVDRFKMINDTYGHLIGDKVILAISEAFNKCCDRDSIYRYGGDEFLIISEFISDEDLDERNRKLREAVAHLKIDGVDEAIECSFGTVHGVAKNGNDFEEMIKQADIKLYEEKERKHAQDYA